jgi:mxaD protein
MTISYRIGGEIDFKALPVSSLTGRIKVKAEAAGTNVSWLARYYRADTTNEPPKGLDDESALNAVNSYIKAGLSGLDKSEVKK